MGTRRKKDRRRRIDPSIAFLSLARAFLRSKTKASSTTMATAFNIRKPRSECLRAERDDRGEEFGPVEEKSIARGEDENNVIHHDKNQVVVLDKMEFVAEQAFQLPASGEIGVDHANKSFDCIPPERSLQERVREMRERHFERSCFCGENCRHENENTQLHSSNHRGAGGTSQLFEASSETRKKCDKIDARIAQLHV